MTARRCRGEAPAPASSTCWPSTWAPAGPRWQWCRPSGRIVAHAARAGGPPSARGRRCRAGPRTNGGRPSAAPPAGRSPSRPASAGDDLIGVGCTSQWSGTVAVGADGCPLMRAVIWMDSRGNQAIREVAGGPVNVLGYDPRKILRWVQVTGGAPGLSGKDPVSHILFIRDAVPRGLPGHRHLPGAGRLSQPQADRAHLRLVRLHRRPLGHRQPGRSTAWPTTSGCSSSPGSTGPSCPTWCRPGPSSAQLTGGGGVRPRRAGGTTGGGGLG